MPFESGPDRGMTMNYAFYDLVGNLGVVLIIGCYFLIQVGKLSASGQSAPGKS